MNTSILRGLQGGSMPAHETCWWSSRPSAGCHGPAAVRRRHAGGGDTGIATHDGLAGADDYQPTYGNADLENALIAERAAEATGERAVDGCHRR